MPFILSLRTFPNRFTAVGIRRSRLSRTSPLPFNFSQRGWRPGYAVGSGFSILPRRRSQVSFCPFRPKDPLSSAVRLSAYRVQRALWANRVVRTWGRKYRRWTGLTTQGSLCISRAHGRGLRGISSVWKHDRRTHGRRMRRRRTRSKKIRKFKRFTGLGSVRRLVSISRTAIQGSAPLLLARRRVRLVARRSRSFFYQSRALRSRCSSTFLPDLLRAYRSRSVKDFSSVLSKKKRLRRRFKKSFLSSRYLKVRCRFEKRRTFRRLLRLLSFRNPLPAAPSWGLFRAGSNSVVHPFYRSRPQRSLLNSLLFGYRQLPTNRCLVGGFLRGLFSRRRRPILTGVGWGRQTFFPKVKKKL